MLASRDCRWLFGGRFVSLAGNAVALTAANWQIYALTRSSLAVGLLSLADSAGMLAGGMLADLYDRRTLLAVVRLPQAALAAGLLAASRSRGTVMSTGPMSVRTVFA